MFIGIIIIVLWLFQVFFLENFYVAIKSGTVKKAANKINEIIREEDYQEKINKIAEKNEFCVVVYSDTGSLLTSQTGDPRCQITRQTYQHNATIIRSLKKTAIRSGKASKLIEEDTLKQRIPPALLHNVMKDYPMTTPSKKSNESMTYISVVKGQDAQLITILINAQLTPVSATVETIQTQFIMIAAILIVIAILLALLLSKRIASPIMSINASAKQLAKGDYDVRFIGDGYTEIKELTDTLNYAARELGKVEGLRRELIANMSHDIRTPLTMIGGFSEVMRDIPGENTPENLQIIIDETRRLRDLVNDMLDLSKLQAGEQRVHCIDVNITKEIETIVHRYDRLRNEKQYRIDFTYTKEVFVHADRIKLDQVIYNLMNNAINYSKEDRHIRIEQTIEEKLVKISIVDHGPGIAKEELPYIWDRYYMVDKTHVRSIVGSGLGLSIVKKILELHHAGYGVKSEANKGSTFWFSLPYTHLK